MSVNSSLPSEPVVTALLASIEKEETAIEQLLIAVASGHTPAIVKAARELAGVRRICDEQNCAE